MDSLKSVVGLGQPEGGGLLGEMDEQCTLSKTNRMIGFGICFTLGFVLSFISPFLLLTNITQFAILYSFGNIIAMCSSMFLMGPCKQLKSMFDPKRLVATIIYLALVGTTLGVALGMKDPSVVLVIFLVILQFCALIWYMASYIPFAQNAIKSCLCSCFK